MTDQPSKSQSMDYLDSPPQRYRKAGNKIFEAADGEWVKFADMDLYMFEGGTLMRQFAEEVEYLRRVWERAKAVHEATCPLCPDHNCNLGNAIADYHQLLCGRGFVPVGELSAETEAPQT